MAKVSTSFAARRAEQLELEKAEQSFEAWKAEHPDPIVKAKPLPRQFDLFPLEVSVPAPAGATRDDLLAIGRALRTLIRHYETR